MMKFVLHLIFLHKRYENIFGWLKALSYDPKFARSFLLRMLPKTATRAPFRVMFHVPHDSDPRNGNRLVGTARYREIKLNCESETRNDQLFLDTSEVSYMVFSLFFRSLLG